MTRAAHATLWMIRHRDKQVQNYPGRIMISAEGRKGEKNKWEEGYSDGKRRMPSETQPTSKDNPTSTSPSTTPPPPAQSTPQFALLETSKKSSKSMRNNINK